MLYAAKIECLEGYLQQNIYRNYSEILKYAFIFFFLKINLMWCFSYLFYNKHRLLPQEMMDLGNRVLSFCIFKNYFKISYK